MDRNSATERTPACNTGMAKVAVQSSACTFVVNQSLVLCINPESFRDGENRHIAKPENVSCNFKKTTLLKETFIGLLTNYTDNCSLTNELWTEIEKHYKTKKRHYHTLQHLDNLLTQLTEVKDEIQNWNTILFTLYYHDIIYNSRKSDNEEKSAELAEKRLKQISVSIDTIELCRNQILATKSHLKSTDSDTNYFTDADLSILGQNWETYSLYYKNVRKEYSIYPDLVYNPGRKKVLTHFLSMDRIYKTDFFFYKFETQAKRNLTNELNRL